MPQKRMGDCLELFICDCNSYLKSMERYLALKIAGFEFYILFFVLNLHL